MEPREDPTKIPITNNKPTENPKSKRQNFMDKHRQNMEKIKNTQNNQIKSNESASNSVLNLVNNNHNSQSSSNSKNARSTSPSKAMSSSYGNFQSLGPNIATPGLATNLPSPQKEYAASSAANSPPRRYSRSNSSSSNLNHHSDFTHSSTNNFQSKIAPHGCKEYVITDKNEGLDLFRQFLIRIYNFGKSLYNRNDRTFLDFKIKERVF